MLTRVLVLEAATANAHNSAMSSVHPPAPPAAPRTRPVSDNPKLAARTAELLQTMHAFVRLDQADAACVVRYMREVSYSRGDVMFRCGDSNSGSAGHMLLVLEGDVSVDASSPGPHGAVPISVLGAGSVLGEMSLLDGAPRSATCTAVTNLLAAGLARKGLERLIEEHPRVGAKLLAGLAQRMAERLRSTAEQLQMYGQIDAQSRQDLSRVRA